MKPENKQINNNICNTDKYYNNTQISLVNICLHIFTVYFYV